MATETTPSAQLNAALQGVVDAAQTDAANSVVDRHFNIPNTELSDVERRMAAAVEETSAILRRFAKGEEPLLSRTIPQLNTLAEKIRNRTI